MTTETTALHQTERYRRRRRLERALLSTIKADSEYGVMPELLWTFVKDVRRPARPEAAALMFACCRWGELATIDWSRVAEGERATITMSKVGASRRGPAAHAASMDDWRETEHPIVLPHQSRRTVADAIRRRLVDMTMVWPSSVKKGTHLIRHLTASAMWWDGYQLEDIAEVLGHARTMSTQHYIHDPEAWILT